MSNKHSDLQRPQQPMPVFVHQALTEHSLWEAYNKRPAYQQNDYLMWINNAKREETKNKRLAQMLQELKTGGVYMRMAHNPSKQ